MSRELARLTEWSWTQGRLDGETALLAFCLEYHRFLTIQNQAAGFDIHFGHRSLQENGVKEIFNDACHYLRLLKYGGAKPESRHPKRIEWLNAEPTILLYKTFLAAMPVTRLG